MSDSIQWILQPGAEGWGGIEGKRGKGKLWSIPV